MDIVLFDHPLIAAQLLPLTFTRPVSEIRVGILTITEKWTRYLTRINSSGSGSENMSYFTRDYLTEKFPLKFSKESVLINGAVTPDHELFNLANDLKPGDALYSEDILIMARLDIEDFLKALITRPANARSLPVQIIDRPYKIFALNGVELERDFQLITEGRKSANISKTNQILGNENVFFEDSAMMECSIINARTGPVYLGHDSEVMEGSVIRGPFALCDHSTLKLGTKIYGPTTIGPHCKVGGEVNNSVFFGFSNKAHDGFLGNSVIGEWCNLGADTNNSNLKNNYSLVDLFNYNTSKFETTGLQFCGLIMGDHSKSGINTMFNTGSVVGVSANIFGAGFPPKHIPSFTWGGAEGLSEFHLHKALELAEKVYDRRALSFDKIEKDILKGLFTQTASHRSAIALT